MNQSIRLDALIADRPTCSHCGQPMRAGEPHWAGDVENRPWHYGCAEKAGLTMSWSRLRQRRA